MYPSIDLATSTYSKSLFVFGHTVQLLANSEGHVYRNHLHNQPRLDMFGMVYIYVQ